MSVHIERKRNFFLVFGALITLTFLTVVAAYFDFGEWNNVIAMGIAVTKASLVVAVFMGVRHSTPLTKLVVIGALLWLAFLLVLTLSDYGTRGLLGIPGK